MAGPGKNPPAATADVLRYVSSKAPSDVLKTLDLLESSGWHTESAIGGQSAPFGDVLLFLAKGSDQIIVERDHGKWFLQIKLKGWSTKFDLGIVLDAMNERTSWDPLPENPYEVEQEPDGIKWLDALPNVLSWLTDTNDVETCLVAYRDRRFRTQFPSLSK